MNKTIRCNILNPKQSRYKGNQKTYMDKKITLNDLSEFYKNEKKLSQFLIDMQGSDSFFKSVSDSTISNILAYSKALSVRNSRLLGTIDFLLN